MTITDTPLKLVHWLHCMMLHLHSPINLFGVHRDGFTLTVAAQFCVGVVAMDLIFGVESYHFRVWFWENNCPDIFQDVMFCGSMHR